MTRRRGAAPVAHEAGRIKRRDGGHTLPAKSPPSAELGPAVSNNRLAGATQRRSPRIIFPNALRGN
jgi:hypothetical protein